MTLEAVRHAIAAAQAEAKRVKAPGGAIAIVVSIGKARTAATFKRPTKFFEDVVNKGHTTMVALPDFTLALILTTSASAAPRALGTLDGRPDAIVDLRAKEGVRVVQSQWRYSDARVVRLAIFGMNGPISDPPANFIWIRSATLDFYRPRPRPTAGEVVRLDPAVDAIVPAGAAVEKLAEGFRFTEGPGWVRDGYLRFSDPNENIIYRWTPDGVLSVFRPKSGYTGVDIGEYGQPGSNGLTLDRERRLTAYRVPRSNASRAPWSPPRPRR